MTDTLSGRALDAAVALVIGPWDASLPDWEIAKGLVPRYSSPDCSGLAPVLAWLDANTGGWSAWSDGMGQYGVWIDQTHAAQFEMTGPTLPEVACRLLVSWSERKRT